MELKDLRYEKDGWLATITLDREETRNAYSDAMIESLVTALDVAEQDDEVRCVVITGAGGTFSGGGDLKLMQARGGMFAGGPVQLRSAYLRGIQRIPRRMTRFEKPTIAAINGPAIGAGLDLACMCDLRIAANGARFGSTFVKLGLIPGDGGAYLLARIVGFPRALEMVMTGRLIDTIEAERIGLVNEIVDGADLMAAVRRQAERIANNAPLAVRLAKSAVYHSWDLNLESALNLAATYQGIVQNTPDHDEGVAATIERRAPHFEGK
ncbi:MAG: 3-hxdroxyacyl-CoA dehydrogenase [Deltaproteobacteria bacterium]|nr:MAG: 3-hxdroxyacyl-CoA dehydrogenase [Deltaproteobacteria bacterium]